MYSSGGDLHLELPTGQQGGTGKLWVRPFVPTEASPLYRARYETVVSSCFAGDSSVWNEGGDESQLLVQRRGQPHGIHQDQNQRSWRGPIHYPPSGGGGHLRFVQTHKPSRLPPFLTKRTQDAFCLLSGWCFPPPSAAPGIYSSTEMLDFGTLRSQGTSPQLQQTKQSSSVFAN